MSGTGRRTGTVAACLLLNGVWPLTKRLALLLRKWQVVHQRVFASHTPETKGQRQFVRQWAALRSASSRP